MSWYDEGNVYETPEKYGLKVVAELEFSDLSYVFDTRVVWRHEETGILYTARDAGCSCPSPFEEYNTLADLEQLASLDTLRDEYKADGGNEDGWGHLVPQEEWARFSRSVRDALARTK